MAVVRDFLTSPTNTVFPYTFPANLVGTVQIISLGAGGQGDVLADVGTGGGGGGVAQVLAYAATPGQTVYVLIDPDNGSTEGNGVTGVFADAGISMPLAEAQSGNDGADGGNGGVGITGDSLATGGNGGTGAPDMSHGGGGGSSAGLSGGDVTPGNNGTNGTVSDNGVGGSSVGVNYGAGGNFGADGELYGGGGGCGGLVNPNGKQGSVLFIYFTSSTSGSDNGLLMRKVGK